MSEICKELRVNLPDLYTDVAFGIQEKVTLAAGETFTFVGKTITLTLDPTTGSRVTIASPDSDITVSVDGLTLTIFKSATWTRTNLAVGNWEYTLYIGGNTDRDVHAHGEFNVVQSRGGVL